jgi:coproporphyrinogen III oxidase-like Fe-S oxidoreductase
VAALTGGETPTLPPGGEEAVDAATATAESLILGLRLDTGVPLATAGEPPLADAFAWAKTAELLEVTADDRVVLTTRGRLLSNELFARLV